MRVGIFSEMMDQRTEVLQQALAGRGITSDQLPMTRFVARLVGRPSVSVVGRRLEEYDGLVIRAFPEGSLEQTVFRLDVLYRLEERGVRLLNSPLAIERTMDSFQAFSVLERHGLPVPRAVVTERLPEAMDAFREFGEAIIKPLFGSRERGGVRVADEEVAYRVFRALALSRSVFYVQEYLSPQHETRALVVGKEVVASMVRGSGAWQPGTLPEEAETLCVETARALRADYLSVDLVRSQDGNDCVTGVDGIPDWLDFERTTGVDTTGKIAEYLVAWLHG